MMTVEKNPPQEICEEEWQKDFLTPCLIAPYPCATEAGIAGWSSKKLEKGITKAIINPQRVLSKALKPNGWTYL